MKRRDIFIVSAIFILALALRIWFLLGVKEAQPILYGDAFNYNGSAVGIIEMFRNAWPNLGFIVNEAMKGTLGKGYNVLHPLGIHFSIIIFKQGPTYSFFIALLFSVFGQNLHIVQYAQAILSGLSCVLLFLLAEKVYEDRRISILAAFLWAVYMPSVYFTELILTETLSVFMLLLVLVMLLGIDRKTGYKAFFAAGIAVAILMLTRHSFRFYWIFIPFGLVPLLGAASPAAIFKKMGFFLCGVCVLLLPWMTLVAFSSGKMMGLPSGRDYWKDLYMDNAPKNSGWPPDSAFTRENNKTVSPYKKLFIDNLRKYPLETGLLYIDKVRRVWGRFLNFRNRKFFIPDGASLLLHRLLAYLGFAGIAFSIFKERKIMPLAVTLLYITVISSIILVESRYNFVGMPIVFIFSAFFIMKCIDASKIIFNSKGLVRASVVIPASIATFFILRQVASLQLIKSVFGWLPLVGAHAVKMTLDSISVLFAAYAAYLIFSHVVDDRRYVMRSAILLAAIFVLFGVVGGLEDRTYAEWQVSLDSGRIAHKTIFLGDSAGDISNIRGLDLLIDMTYPDGADMNVQINGRQYLYSDMARQERMEKTVYDDVLKLKSLKPYMIRQWHVVQLPLDSIKNNFLDIKISSTGSKDGYPVIFGDYKKPDEKLYEGPSFARSPEETSLYKFAYDDDYRLPHSEKLYNRSTEDNVKDGEYRIRLEIWYGDGTVRTY